MLNGGDEGVLYPSIIIDDLLGGLSFDGGVGDVGVLGSRVVSPDGELLDVSDSGVLFTIKSNIVIEVQSNDTVLAAS